MSDRLFARLARALDATILWRLGLVPLDVPARLECPPVDVADFWQASTVRNPSPVSIVRELGTRAGGAIRAVDLEGPSSGRGGHPGSTKLMARGYLLHRRPAAPLVLIIHGYAVPLPLYEERYARALLARGAHALRIDLPFHLRRRLTGQRSGDGFFAADLDLVRGAVRQSVEDAAALVGWARHHTGGPVAVLGFSLGGLVASLLAAQVQLDSMVAVAPLCDPPETILDCMPRRSRRRLGLVGGSGGPWGPDLTTARRVMRDALAPLVPHRLAPVTAPGRITLVAAGRDTIVRPETVHRLADAWGARCWTYPGHGHITVMSARGLTARVCEELVSRPSAIPSASLRVVR